MIYIFALVLLVRSNHTIRMISRTCQLILSVEALRAEAMAWLKNSEEIGCDARVLADDVDGAFTKRDRRLW